MIIGSPRGGWSDSNGQEQVHPLVTVGGLRDLTPLPFAPLESQLRVGLAEGGGEFD